MNTSMLWQDLSLSVNLDARLSAGACAPGQVKLQVSWDEMNEAAPVLEIRWQRPLYDIQYNWFPVCGKDRSLRVDWYRPVRSKISSSAPVFCFFNAAGRNRFTMALSDVRTDIRQSLGVREEDGMLLCHIAIPLDATGCTHEYEVTLYRDDEDVTLAEALRRVSRWWNSTLGLVPMTVPESARMPMYSTWYSFHQATIAADIEEECARAARLGLKTVIVDDGWQTGDGNRGYGYCGDWRPATEKIPDMRAHVARVHALGMRYVLWYSVPFVGQWSAHWDTFKDKMLSVLESQHAGVLDPRYPEVRSYLIDTYVSALRDWDLDGFKLDFVDSFSSSAEAPAPKPGMDFVTVEDAVFRLMTDVMNALRAIKPDILIEFRQSYIGPAMRTFGNMFRVADCPADLISNRVGVLDLRLLSGDTAVHSDMLMWHKDDSVQNAARHILNILFGVPQISVRLDQIPEDHLRMLRFFIDFITRHRALLSADLEVESPEALYPLARTRLGDEAAVVVYDRHVAQIDAPSTYLFNATADDFLTLRTTPARALHARLFDCCGTPLGEVALPESTLHELNVPASGFALIR